MIPGARNDILSGELQFRKTMPAQIFRGNCAGVLYAIERVSEGSLV